MTGSVHIWLARSGASGRQQGLLFSTQNKMIRLQDGETLPVVKRRVWGISYHIWQNLTFGLSTNC